MARKIVKIYGANYRLTNKYYGELKPGEACKSYNRGYYNYVARGDFGTSTAPGRVVQPKSNLKASASVKKKAKLQTDPQRKIIKSIQTLLDARDKQVLVSLMNEEAADNLKSEMDIYTKEAKASNKKVIKIDAQLQKKREELLKTLKTNKVDKTLESATTRHTHELESRSL
jgi:hypothetical protein